MLERSSTPRAMSGDCSWIAVIDAAGLAVEAELGVRVADIRDRLADDRRDVDSLGG